MGVDACSGSSRSPFSLSSPFRSICGIGRFSRSPHRAREATLRVNVCSCCGLLATLTYRFMTAAPPDSSSATMGQPHHGRVPGRATLAVTTEDAATSTLGAWRRRAPLQFPSECRLDLRTAVGRSSRAIAQSVVLAGDSTACTLLPGLQASAPRRDAIQNGASRLRNRQRSDRPCLRRPDTDSVRAKRIVPSPGDRTLPSEPHCVGEHRRAKSILVSTPQGNKILDSGSPTPTGLGAAESRQMNSEYVAYADERLLREVASRNPSHS